MNELIKKATNWYQYIEDLIKLRLSTVWNVSEYIDLIWLYDIPHEKWCHCAVWGESKEEGDPIWIEIKRPVLPKVPTPPEECNPWIENIKLEKYDQIPELNERIIEYLSNEDSIEEQEQKYLHIKDFPDIIHAWESYIEAKWKVWANEYKKAKQVQDIYSRMFTMYQQQKVLGESYEVIIGIGLLNCKTETGAKIFRHIISAHTELNFEPNNGTIVLKAAPDGAKPQFEVEMLDPSELPNIEIQKNLESELERISNDIWEKPAINTVLRSWINSFDSKSQYYDQVEQVNPKDNENNPIGSFTPAIILRKRTNRGIIRFLKKIKDQMAEDGQIPASIQAFLEIDNDLTNSQKDENVFADKESSGNSNLPKEIYFPLSSNEEQRSIINAISNRKGVLVQGPPGTGKSHTIANLISHLLATGKKVLVTSQTARALKVLKSKLSDEVKPLCVSILGTKQEDFDDLKCSVQDITNKFYSWDKRKNSLNISKFERDLYEHKKKLQQITVSLKELREKETYHYDAIDGGYSGTAQSIATQLKNREDEFGWIPDEIAKDEQQPISQEEFCLLIDNFRAVTEERINELNKIRIDSSSIFSPEAFVEIVRKEQKYKNKEQQIENDIEIRLLYDKFKKIEFQNRKNLLDSIRLLNNAISESCRRPLPWLEVAVCDFLGDQDQPLRELFSITEKHLNGMKEKAIIADECNVSYDKSIDPYSLKADAEDLLRYLEQEKTLGWWIFRPKIYKRVKYLTEAVRVNGRLCVTKDTLNQLINYISVDINLSYLESAWKDKVHAVNGTKLHRASFLCEQMEALDVILKIEPLLIKAKTLIKEVKVINEPKWHNKKELEKTLLALDATFIIDEIKRIEIELEKVKTALKVYVADNNTHEINSLLLVALDERDWSSWGKAYNSLLKLKDDQKMRENLLDLTDKLKKVVPEFADNIYHNPLNECWGERKYKFDAAWNWLRADAWLSEYAIEHDEYQLQKDYEEYDKHISKTISRLASLKAWEYCFSEMNEKQRQHLVAWSQSIQKIGKGTGKRAEKHRRDAEGHMNECRDAIPAWIMPLYRVADTISPKSECFDVVIIDEASQSGPEALFLLYIAKKCIVVGDDQQISPQGVGVNRQDVDLLIERYLSDIPMKDSYGPESSLFSHAQIRYGTRIVLREHFRCVPQIIQFSNDLCYAPLGTSLIPLRPESMEKLDSICTCYVKTGYREGKDQTVINKPEADALVAQVAMCCENPKYEGKSIGVIVLQGNSQSALIERLLIEKIGPGEMEKRSIICGTPYDFQGDERDVIFLSMVAAPNVRIGPLVKAFDMRRFNVAFSRARDQIWLFHSVTLNDLSQSDYRHRLLSYCIDPKRFTYNVEDDIFDSNFEKSVYEHIKAKGYNVIPQFKVANYKIDLVVEGMRSRLAVECDGDEWHGIEEYEDDQKRQRILERSGWRFWRIRGSDYYRDPEQALEPLWQILNDLEATELKTSKQTDFNQQTNKTVVKKEEVEQSISTEDLKDENVSVKYKDNGLLEHSKLDLGSRTENNKSNKLRNAIISLLNQGTQGMDLLPDKVLRELAFKHRGRERSKQKKRIVRIVNDLKREGLVEEYKTGTRKRIKLLICQNDLFN